MRRAAFTLIELLVCISIISLLVGILLPSLAGARAAARQTLCASNIRQLAMSVQTYATDYKGFAAPGAANFLANKNRWHGARASIGQPFVAQGGSLSSYYGDGDTTDTSSATTVRSCPEFAATLSQLATLGQGFERRCGGYGYNNAYLGVQRGLDGTVRSDRSGSSLALFQSPDRVITFTDTAFAAGDVPGDIIEYSFAEPRFLDAGNAQPADPSVHFRHGGKTSNAQSTSTASVAWLDGHVTSEQRTFTWLSGLYPADPGPLRIGWFGPQASNILFSGR